MAIYNDDISSVFKKFNSSISGLKNSDIEIQKSKYGINELDKQKKNSFLKKLFLQFKNIMIIILILSAIISCSLAIVNHDYENLFEGILIFIIVIINAIIGVIQEQKAENTLFALTKITEPYALILRNGIEQKIKVHELVVGDIVILKTGNFVPADIRLFECKNLKCNESSLTGESNSISKNSKQLLRKNLQISEQTNMCFSGTAITSGTAKGIVVAVGKNTEIGKIARILNSSSKEKTPLEKEIDKIGKILTIAVLTIVFVVLVIHLVSNVQLDFMNSLLTAVTLAVAAIPESLPAVITIIMALGVQRLAKKNAVIKKLSSVETLGCCNIICSDKTGTLTKNEMSITHINLNLKTSETLNLSNKKFIEVASVCNNAKISENKIVADPTETAIIKLLQQNKIDINPFKQKFKKLNELEFDSSKKQMRVLCSFENSQILFSKGAIDYLLPCCNKILIDNEEIELNEKLKKKLLIKNEEVCKLGERVIAFAYKQNALSLNDNNLVFVGFVGISDPPRKEVFGAINKCKHAGLKTIMITGDHPSTAFAIAKNLGIAKSQKEVLTGNDINNLNNDELIKNMSKYSVFARVTPEHKLKIVKALKSQNNIVAMTGDGINDAPSIKSANIGVCMGKTGTDVTKEVSDIIISDDNFSTIVLAIEEGRTIYQNISKTILFLISTNLVEVLGIFITSLIMPTSIFLLPTQILFINLVTDSLPAFALGIEPPEKNIMNIPPRNPTQNILSGRTGSLIIYEGFIQAFVVLLSFIISANLFGNETASTISFLTICLMQIIHAINCKTENSIFKINIFNNKFFNFSFLFLFCLILFIYFNPLTASLFSLTTLSINQWLIVAATSISIIPLVEFGKLIIK